ncbi:hypothetical protein VNI00_016517 [Paramarasmius palmivorus]|uniref:Uncharacterized protein n=1 Tax=Paramarasmius palmivorus TaxID=297713 RepID=A0AAW0BER2_9AGAR
MSLSANTSPPLNLANLSAMEKTIIQNEIQVHLEYEITKVARIRGYETLSSGQGHLWSSVRTNYGRQDWNQVGRLYRRCYSFEHNRQRLPCAYVEWVTDSLPARLRRDIERLRCLFDMFQARGKWSRDGVVGDTEELITDVLWEHREKTAILSLRAAFEQFVDDERDELEVARSVSVVKDEEED